MAEQNGKDGQTERQPDEPGKKAVATKPKPSPAKKERSDKHEFSSQPAERTQPKRPEGFGQTAPTSSGKDGKRPPQRERPDVFVDAHAHVGRIEFHLDNLKAAVRLHAQVLDLLELSVGADASLEHIGLIIEDVQVDALVEVRLDAVENIVVRLIEAIDHNPEIIRDLTRGVGKAVEEVGEGAGEGVKSIGEGTGKGVEQIGGGVGSGVEEVGKGAGKGVEGAGKGVGKGVEKVGEGAGQGVKGAGEGVGKGVEKTGEGVGEGVKETGKGVGKAGEGAGKSLEKSSSSSRPNGKQSKEEKHGE